MRETDRGLIGVFLSVISPTIDYLNVYLQFAGAALGVVLVLVSILHKILQVRKINKER